MPVNTNSTGKQYNMRELIGRFLPYFKPYRMTLVTDLICASLTTICELVLPMIIRNITNTAVQDVAALTMSLLTRMCLLYLVLRLVDLAAYYYMCDMGHVMGVYMETDMRRDAYGHLQKLSANYFNNTKVGQIMGRITNDLFDVTEFAHHCPEEFLIAIVKIVGSFIILAGINLKLTIIVFLFVPIMSYCCIWINLHMRRIRRELRHQIGELNARIEDTLLGQQVVKAFTNEDLEIARFEDNIQKYQGLQKESYKIMATALCGTRLFDGAMYLTVVFAGGVSVIRGGIGAADLVAYVLYVSTLIASVRRIVDFAEIFQRGLTGIERFLQIMDADIEIFDSENAVALTETKGNIRFENVEFFYPDDKNQVFRGLNLEIHPGEKVAIVGPSGGGKTTLCNLIPRFYDVSGGSIYLDGKNVRDYTLKSLRQNIGMVQQDVYLFSGTVMENILYGRPTATREEAMEAAKRAGAHEFILSLKDGYDTYIGERGVKLSGGQKQRLSIARVFLKNPAILILDEATSALDNESEYAVARSLERLAEGRTTLTVAHRLSSIRNSDRILVLTEDGIVEEGSHDELLARKGLYYEFYQLANEIK